MKRNIKMNATMIYKEDLINYMKNTYNEVANESYLKMVDKIVVTAEHLLKLDAVSFIGYVCSCVPELTARELLMFMNDKFLLPSMIEEKERVIFKKCVICNANVKEKV